MAGRTRLLLNRGVLQFLYPRTRHSITSQIHRLNLRKLKLAPLNAAFYCTTSIPYETEDFSVVYRNGLPSINIMLPSRDEHCLFTLRPLTDTVGSFLSMISEEDGGIERIAIYRKDGLKIAKATTIDLLLQDDFDLIINDRKFAVLSPKIDLSGDEVEGAAQVKDLITQLYTTMNLTDWQASKEKELTERVEKLKQELAPFEEIKAEMMAKAEKKATRLTWLGLGLMGVQFGFLARLTWWEYSWDIMEPVTYFVTYGTSMAMFAYYVLTKQEYIFPDAKDRSLLINFHKYAKKNNYDISEYNSMVEKLRDAESDLRKVKQPLGVSLTESELKVLQQQIKN